MTKTARLNVLTEPELKEKLFKLAEEDHRSLSALVGLVLQDFVDRKEKEDDRRK